MKTNLKYLLFFCLNSASFFARSQDVLDFKIIMDGIFKQYEIHDSLTKNDGILIEHKSDYKTSYCQQSIYPNGMTLFCFEPLNETSYYYEADSIGRIRLYSIKTNIKLVAYKYYPSGKLESYSIQEEDTSFNNQNKFSQFRLTPNSFTFQFNEDGSTKSKIYFTQGCQNLIVYWPNKRIKIIADYDANRYSYCGKYKEFDTDGNLLIKGKYYLSDEPLSESRKIGIWKYYESGKLKKKERHYIN